MIRIIRSKRAAITAATLAMLTVFIPAARPQTQARVPFVGCAGNGNAGPIAAPEPIIKVIQTDARTARRLAYYGTQDGPGILAPRGWHCFETSGSSGSSLFVTPEPIKSDGLFSANWKGFTGPAIEVDVIYGNTSGRFDVARIVARVFPAERAFVQGVMREEIEPASDFTVGPYPEDKLAYKGKGDRIVEYRTPPRSEGLGTIRQLQKNDDPINGVAILRGQPPDLLFLAMRLTHDTSSLGSTIIQRFEREGDNQAAPK